MWTLSARWIFPVAGPPLERGTVTIDDDQIFAVAPHGTILADLDLGEAAVLPGLVNTHTHLDLSGMRGLAPPSPDFTGWLRQVIAFRRAQSFEQVGSAVQVGLEECLRYGTTLVGDISGDGSSWDPLAKAPLRAVAFRELLGLSYERADAALVTAKEWLETHPATPTCRAALSPHAPYSARLYLYRRALQLANEYHTPVAIHLAESRAELKLLKQHDGPFVPFLRDLNAWMPTSLAKHPREYIRLGTKRRIPKLFIHGNYLARCALVPHRGSVVYCPRTHAAFGHTPHPFRSFLARRKRVAIGTDSLASNPDLDVLAEIRFLHRLYPDMPGKQLLRMATLAGAEALGWQDETGSLSIGKSADLVVIPLSPRQASDPHELFLAGSEPVRDVLFRGRWVRGPLSTS